MHIYTPAIIELQLLNNFDNSSIVKNLSIVKLSINLIDK